MLRKAIIQLMILAGAFFATWYTLSRVDFINEQEYQLISEEKQERLGDLILESLTQGTEEVTDEGVVAVIDSLKTRICRTQFVSCDAIKIHVIRNPQVNAFALPGNHIVIFTGLIEYAENAEEVAGVMAHEIGHLEKNHVMKKLIKEIGIEMLFAIIGGDAGFEIIRQTGKTLSSTAFDRANELEADAYAVETLALADVDPLHLSNFFFRMSQDHHLPRNLSWLSTHPHSTDRAAEIIRKKKELIVESRAILATPWSQVKKWLEVKEDVARWEDKKNKKDL